MVFSEGFWFCFSWESPSIIVPHCVSLSFTKNSLGMCECELRSSLLCICLSYTTFHWDESNMQVVRLWGSHCPCGKPYKPDAGLGLSILAGPLLYFMVNIDSCTCHVLASQSLPHSKDDLVKCSPALGPHILSIRSIVLPSISLATILVVSHTYISSHFKPRREKKYALLSQKSQLPFCVLHKMWCPSTPLVSSYDMQEYVALIVQPWTQRPELRIRHKEGNWCATYQCKQNQKFRISKMTPWVRHLLRSLMAWVWSPGPPWWKQEPTSYHLSYMPTHKKINKQCNKKNNNNNRNCCTEIPNIYLTQNITASLEEGVGQKPPIPSYFSPLCHSSMP